MKKLAFLFTAFIFFIFSFSFQASASKATPLKYKNIYYYDGLIDDFYYIKNLKKNDKIGIYNFPYVNNSLSPFDQIFTAKSSTLLIENVFMYPYIAIKRGKSSWSKFVARPNARKITPALKRSQISVKEYTDYYKVTVKKLKKNQIIQVTTGINQKFEGKMEKKGTASINVPKETVTINSIYVISPNSTTSKGILIMSY